MKGDLGAIIIFTVVILFLIFIVRTIFDVIGNNRLSLGYKIVWILIIFIAPLIGAIAYTLAKKNF